MRERCPSTRTQYLVYGGLAAAVIVLGLLMSSDCLRDWDSFGYTYLATRARSSSFYLGRWWFILAMRLAWLVGDRLFGLTMLEAHLPMQAASLAFSCLAAIGLSAWTLRLTGNAKVSAWAGVAVGASPLFWLYATSVMTEPMALAALAWSLYAWQRALLSTARRPAEEGAPADARDALLWAGLSGLLYGVAVDIREPLVLLAPWPLLASRLFPGAGRHRLLGVALAGAVVSLGAGVAGGWAWSWRRGFGYFSNMRGFTNWISSATTQYPTDYAKNLAALGRHLLFVSPFTALALALGVALLSLQLVRRLRRRAPLPLTSGPSLGPALWAALSTLPYILSLLINPDLPFNPRYALPLGGMLAPLAASLVVTWLERERSSRPVLRSLRPLVCSVALALLAARLSVPLREDQEQTCSGINRIRNAVLALPQGALVLPGNATPIAQHLVRMGIRSDLRVISAGWSFPADRVDEIIRDALAEGRAVYVHPYRHAWTRRGTISRQWRSLFEAVEPYSCEPLTERTAPFIAIRGQRRPGDPGQPEGTTLASSRVLACFNRAPSTPARRAPQAPRSTATSQAAEGRPARRASPREGG